MAADADPASGYNVLVDVSDGGVVVPLTAITVPDNSLSMVVPTQTGRTLFVVQALGLQLDPHFNGAVQNQLEITIQK